MKIGIISDTHDRLESVKRATEIFKDNKVEMIIHAGDWVSPFVLDYFDSAMDGFKVPVKSIFGNNEKGEDRFENHSETLSNPIEFHKDPFEIEIDSKKILVSHGTDQEELQKMIDSQKYDVIFTGHTHKIRYEMIGKTLVLNPGSTSFVYESRIIDKASVAIFDTKNNDVKIIEFTKNDLL